MAFSLDPNKFLLEANEFSVPTRGNNLRRGQAYYSSTQAPGSMVTPMAPMIDMGGTNTLGSAADKENALGMRFAGDAIAHMPIKRLQKKLAKAERAAARKVSWLNVWQSLRAASRRRSIIACDERFKEDMAPLQTSEVNDDLAQMAFAVQEIRGHS